MDEFNYADSYLGEYKIKGDEIVAEYCPECGGGSHRDKHTFYLNYNRHTYICHRGSCGARGTFSLLASEKGGKAQYMAEIFENTFKTKKVYVKPVMKLTNITDQANKYIKSRGISVDTVNHFGIKTDTNGNIVFPFIDEKGEHELNKIRLPRKFVKGKDKTKIWQEGAGRPILFGMNLVKDTETLIITEGEWDCLTVYECGLANVVSVPFGTNNFEWVSECWDWLENFKQIVVFFDNDSAGKIATEEAIRKLGIWRVYVARSDCKDANELMFKFGQTAVKTAVSEAETTPVKNFVRLSDVEEYGKEGMLYGLSFVDNTIGGCVNGELNIWTGKRGGAKSSILSQTVVDSVEQEKKVFWYSGELSNARVRNWLETQMCGAEILEEVKNNITNRPEKVVPKEVSKILREYYRDYLFIFGDEGGNNEDDLFKIMEYAYRRHDIKRFILDNLKTVKFANKLDKYQQQSEFVGRCKTFCNQFKVHIDLVVHPRKSNNNEMIDEDIGGSVDIIDLADNVMECKKVAYSEVKEQSIKDMYNLDTNRRDLFLNKIKILKNREYGRTGYETYYKFNIDSRRIETAYEEQKNYRFMDKLKNIGVVFQEVLDDMPF